jgi:hypothetical protein
MCWQKIKDFVHGITYMDVVPPPPEEEPPPPPEDESPPA